MDNALTPERLELNELEFWFETTYRPQKEQYDRCVLQGTVYDRDIQALLDDADAKQLRIRELITILSC